MIDRIRQFSTIPALSFTSSKNAYSIPSTTKSSAVAANTTSALLAPNNSGNNFPPSSGLLPAINLNGQRTTVPTKDVLRTYPDTFISAIKDKTQLDLNLRSVNNIHNSGSFLLPKVTELAQKALGRKLPKESEEHVRELGKLIEAYRIALSNKAAFRRKGLNDDSPRMETGTMMELAVKTSGKQNFQALEPEEKLNYYAITGDIDSLWNLIKMKQDKIMSIAREIADSSQKEVEFKQFTADLSNFVERCVGANNIVPFARKGSLV